ncbi:PAS-domain containing protein [Falsihalocynthiibacter arcticus]|uniref:PAS-domain containing protein n=1 Tax=Falsihalocynthiibacter arcticus TaxID=1579316 RepID=UPI001C54C1A5|nr:PAS-domain containing protein [Falsihalocynthiibacter arcticus]
MVFLFDDEKLVDATTRARALLNSRPQGSSEWRQFCVLAQTRFPDLPLEMAELASEGSLTIQASDPADFAEIRAEWWNGVARIELVEDATASTETVVDPHSMNAMKRELETLRKTAEMSPYYVWQQTVDGVITWANSSYFTLSQEFDGSAEKPVQTWPPSRLFQSVSLAQGSPEGRAHRVSVKFPEETNGRWYEVFSTTIGDESLHFATSADGVVRAETALRDFVQTLTKTFAHLPTGLAIFDKKRQLALFNPALTDLTGLQPMFLSLRPTLVSFLDKLREGQVIPEPKNYKGWRAQISALEAAAVDGTYSETWTLPSGQTYRVTGRPHPDGAVAFLFEDISAEVSLTRRFRRELEIGQAVLDSFREAIAVFASDGMLTMSNSTYTSLWGVDPGTTLGEMSVVDAMAHWRTKCEDSALWSSIQSYIATNGSREEKSFKLRLLEGGNLTCRLAPVAGGGTLIAFAVISSPALTPLEPIEPKALDTEEVLHTDGASKPKDPLLFKIEA